MTCGMSYPGAQQLEIRFSICYKNHCIQFLKFLEVDGRVQPDNAIANLLNVRNLKQELPTNQYQIIANNNFQCSQCAQTSVWQSVLVLGHEPCTLSILVPYIVPNAGFNPITSANEVLTFSNLLYHHNLPLLRPNFGINRQKLNSNFRLECYVTCAFIIRFKTLL